MALVVAAGGLAASTRSASGPSVTTATDPGEGPSPAFASTVLAPDASTTVAPAEVTEPAAAPDPTQPAAIAVTGSFQGCGELHRFVDDDGDTWGECVNDVEGAHRRAQQIVAFLGYDELTCHTDPNDASSVCEGLAPDGSVHELLIQMTGDLTHDVVARPAPTTTTPPPPPVPFVDTAGGCDPNYSGCVPIDSDVDCAGGSGNGPSYAAGPVRVIGRDIYDLDRDGDGVGC